jgi:replicative DNA helicase
VTGLGRKEEFVSMPARLVNERTDRAMRAGKILPYHIAFFDDALSGILPNDLVLLGAPSGMGKTDLAMSIAVRNAARRRKVHYFALEAEDCELERRTKYALLSSRLFEAKHPQRHRMNYTDWYLCKLEDICGPLNAAVDEEILANLATMKTYYREKDFTASTMTTKILEIHHDSSLIVVDHLHYIDSDDDNEHRALGDTVKAVRDVSLRIGVPILLVAHLRKRDPRGKQLIASLDDFHGSSNVTKIATHVLAIERANIESDKWWLAPTFFSVLKDRRGGYQPLVAMTNYDKRTKGYENKYALGRISGGEWTPIDLHDRPDWARHYSPGQFAGERPQ